jgi:hypothetical protein
MTQHTPIYVVASPHPHTGKTLIARLLMEFLLANNRPLVGFDLNPREPELAPRFPQLVWTLDIADTRGQMALFDLLIADDTATKVIDLGYAAFDKFFAVMNEIGFVAEARRRLVEPIVLFVTDSAPTTARSYAELQGGAAPPIFVPVHNEAVSVIFTKKDFPPAPAECGVVRLPRLSSIVRGVIDRPNFSFRAYLNDQPGGPTEMHTWIAGIFREFRELELRLLIGKLSSALGGNHRLLEHDAPGAR